MKGSGFNIGDQVEVLYKGSAQVRVGEFYTIARCCIYAKLCDVWGEQYHGPVFSLGPPSTWVAPAQIRRVDMYKDFDAVYNALV